MARRLLAIVVAVTAAALLLAASSSPRSTREGGIFRVGMSGGLLASVDPALQGGRHVLGATCAGLMNMPDRPGRARMRLVPEIAAGYPEITNGGKTYTFTIQKGVRFSTGARVTARSVAYTINRELNPTLNSPFAGDFKSIVGAQKVIDGRAGTASGVVPRGNTLVIRLTKPGTVRSAFFLRRPRSTPRGSRRRSRQRAPTTSQSTSLASVSSSSGTGTTAAGARTT
jgi:ABC-type transport system substrate-binding protein